MDMAASRVDKMGRVYLPRNVRDALSISPDEPLDINVVGEKIVLERKRRSVAEEARGIFKLKKRIADVDVEIRRQSVKVAARELHEIRRR